MIDYKYKDLFQKSSVDKQIYITDAAGEVSITNKELRHQKFELTETLCSEERLVFGCCEASVLKFTVANVFLSLKGKWLSTSMTLNGNTDEAFNLGIYKVQSDKPTADRKKREYIAYDALYDIINAEVSIWYNTLLPNNDSTVILKEFRDSFFSYFGIEQEETTLINDTMTVEKTIRLEELSGKTVINCICEANGCFGHIGRNGKFKYIYLTPIQEGLYPNETFYPNEMLYPSEPNTNVFKAGRYISASYEDYIVEQIDKLLIRGEEDSVACEIGSGSNTYVIRDNFLLYGKSEDELQNIGQRILSKIGGIYYRPFTAKARGNPCLEVGDGISLSTKYMIIHSYILQRTLTGIQALRDEYTADGMQYQPAEVNSTARDIQLLKGKTNRLIRTVDETRSELQNLESDTETRFLQTSEEISAEAKRAQEAEASLKIQADGIALSVEDLEKDIGAQIELLTGEISLKVDAGDIINEINISDEAIVLDGNRLIVNSTNFQLDANGNVSITGEINADSGKIGALEINGSGFVLGDLSDGSSGYLSLSQISICEVWADEIYGGEINANSIYSASSGTVDIKDSLSVSGDLDVSGGIRSEYFYPDSVIANYISSEDIYGKNIECDYINNGVPITSENYWLYAPAIELTTHEAGGYGSYYYGTDSPYASGDNKSIPSIQWVKDYVNSKLSS